MAGTRSLGQWVRLDDLAEREVVLYIRQLDSDLVTNSGFRNENHVSRSDTSNAVAFLANVFDFDVEAVQAIPAYTEDIREIVVSGIPDVLDKQVAAIAEREGFASKSELVRTAIRQYINETDYKFAQCTECGTIGFTWDAEQVPGNCPYCNGGPYLAL